MFERLPSFETLTESDVERILSRVNPNLALSHLAKERPNIARFVCHAFDLLKQKWGQENAFDVTQMLLAFLVIVNDGIEREEREAVSRG